MKSLLCALSMCATALAARELATELARSVASLADGDLNMLQWTALMTDITGREEAEYADHVRGSFDAMDLDGDGVASVQELAQALDEIAGDGLPWLRAPGELHISPTGTGTGMTVMWATVLSYEAGEDATVDYGEVGAPGSQSATATSYTYAIPVRWWSNGKTTWQHRATLDIQPGKEYWYNVGGASAGGRSANFTFTAPVAPGPDAATRLAIVGDMGSIQILGFKTAKSMQEQNAKTPFNGLLIAGDISYAGLDTNIPALNITNQDEFQPFWDLYMAMMQPLAARMPFFVTHGNHDDFPHHEALAYSHRFLNPTAGGGNSPFWWSTDLGNLHICSLSSERDYSPGSEQYEWAQQDLAKAAANRHTVPHILVVAHRPFYSSSEAEWSAHHAGSHFISSMEPLFLRYNVTMTFTGHLHAVERMSPMVNGTMVTPPVTGPDGLDIYRNPRAPVYYMAGSGGALQDNIWRYPRPAYSAWRRSNTMASYGFVTIDTVNATHILTSFVSNKPDGDVHDSFWIAH